LIFGIIVVRSVCIADIDGVGHGHSVDVRIIGGAVCGVMRMVLPVVADV
jgi:hypothetical protein